MPALRSLAAALLAGAITVPASAQQPASTEKSVARVIHGAMAPSSYGDWRYRWDAVSARISSLMHWHIYGRDPADDDTLTRRGWISTPGLQIGVSAYGDGETVSSLAFEVHGRRAVDATEDAVLVALSAEGVAANEIEQREPPEFFHTETPIIIYRLSAPQREEATLTISESCTSPRSAAAQRCSINYELALGG